MRLCQPAAAAAIACWAVLCTTSFLATASEGRIFNTAEKTAVLKLINELRDSAANKAAMHFVGYSNRLASMIDVEAKKCKLPRSSKSAASSKEGETMYMGSSGDAAAVLMSWYSEKSHYNHATKTCTAGKQCDQYLQLMRPSLFSFGCAKQSCSGVQHLVLCKYSHHQATNIADSLTGPPCSSCSATMPFCVHRRCAFSYISNVPDAKLVFPGLSAKSVECKMSCRNCGKLDAASCKCACKEASGSACQNKNKGSKSKCSPCGSPSICLNGGVGDASDLAKCKCKCRTGYVGERCEFTKEAFDSSVKLVLAIDKEAKVLGSDSYKYTLPVPVAVFENEIWFVLQSELTNAVNAFCAANKENFVMCCPGKTYPGSAKVARKNRVSKSNVNYNVHSLQNIDDGSLVLLVHASNSKNDLCSAATGKMPTANFITSSALASAIRQTASTISSKLSACCNDVVLHNFKRPTSVPKSQTTGVNSKTTAFSSNGAATQPEETPPSVSRANFTAKSSGARCGTFVESTTSSTFPILAICHLVLNLPFTFAFS